MVIEITLFPLDQYSLHIVRHATKFYLPNILNSIIKIEENVMNLAV